MTLTKFVTSLQDETTFPRDRIMNTLYFNATAPFVDRESLCADLLQIWRTKWYTALGARELAVRAYDVGPPPQFPKAEAIFQPGGTAPTTGLPRELALCLSYYSERNLPRQRGRTYLSGMAGGFTSTAARPPAATITKALDLADALSGLGGVDIDWVVYSPTDQAHRKVSMAWVDNAWDIQRRRGLTPTARTERAQSG